MNKLMKRLVLLALSLALALCQAAFAESDHPLQAVYDALIAEGSELNQTKDLYAQYYEGVTLDAALQDGSIVITQESANEWVQSGVWTFTLEGDDLTIVLPEDDYSGLSMVMTMFQAVASARGVNSSLLNGYVAGLGEDNPFLTSETDESAGSTKYSIHLNASFDLEGLDQMIMTSDTVSFFDPLEEEYTSRGGNYGKVIMVMNGNVHGITMLVCEYGQLDEVAYQDIVNAVSATKPEGWETFTAEYTELKDADTEGYSVTLNPDDAQVGQIIDDRYEGYQYAIVRIGQSEYEGEDEPVMAQMPEAGWVLDSVYGAVWQDDRASLEVFLEDVDNYKVVIHWGSSAWETAEWVYTCDYDAETQTLRARYVICDDLVYDDAGNETRTNVYEKESEALFSLNEDGQVLLQNAGEEQLEGKTFARLEV